MRLSYCIFLLLAVPLITNAANKDFSDLEKTFNGRLGISAINTANKQTIQYRADEYFPLQSTFKVMLVAAILKQSMHDKNLLQEKIIISKENLVSWSPITEKYLMHGMTIAELCAAALMYSDNTATNLLLKKLGGPQAVTAFARTIGDKSFRLSSIEPKLNTQPNTLNDTSTPKTMTKNLQKLFLGNVLAPPQQEQLINWLKNNTTGDARIRAGVPANWQVADKTGSSTAIANDIAVIWPEKCAPIIMSLYFIHNKKTTGSQDKIIALATHKLLQEFAKNDPCLLL